MFLRVLSKTKNNNINKFYKANVLDIESEAWTKKCFNFKLIFNHILNSFYTFVVLLLKNGVWIANTKYQINHYYDRLWESDAYSGCLQNNLVQNKHQYSILFPKTSQYNLKICPPSTISSKH